MSVVLLAFDAMDPTLTRRMAAQGRLPNFARLLGSATSCQVRNPVGLFVGSLWSSFFTSRSAVRTGFHCWEEIVPGQYERRVTSAEAIEGTPFWETLSDAGKRVAVLDVPHSRAGTPLHGVQVSEWGCHDRHFGLRTWPAELAQELVQRYGLHPVLGADPWTAREWAPDDYLFREGSRRTPDEERALLEGLLAGARAKSRLSADILVEAEWDLFLSVFGEPHSVGHQLWHLHDPSHPRHEVRKQIGDPVQRIYEQMDLALGEHLRAIGEDDDLLVLLSHGMGPHNDATHLLPEILRRLHDGPPRSLHGAALGRAWRALPDRWRDRSRPALAALLDRRRRGLVLNPVRDAETERERREQRFFMSPNNFVVGGIRVNLLGREREGKVQPGAEFDQLCEWLREELMALVNVDTGAPVVRSVERTDRYYERVGLDAVPDLFLEWNQEHPIETIWSPRFGMIHGPYVHWRTGDHRPDGLLLVRGGRAATGKELAIEDIGPSIAHRLGVGLDDVDGVAQRWLLRAAEANLV